MKPATRVAVAVVLLAVGAVAAWCAKPRPTPDGPLTIPDSLIFKLRPKLKPTVAERILTHAVRPTAVATSAAPADQGRGKRFCEAAAAAGAAPASDLQTSASGEATSDSATAGHIPAGKPTPLLPSVSGRYDGTYLTLWLVRSDDSTKAAAARLRPRFTFLAGQGGVSDTLPIFREDRWFVRFARRTAHCLPRGGAGALVGAVTSKAEERLERTLITGSVTLLGCLI